MFNIRPAILLLSFITLFSLRQAGAQGHYPKDYFRSPVDFPIYLSGTFGELRSGHFHSGIDIKTGGVTGKKIYAAGDGHISRVKVSATGFGKTLYVTHPNGYVSVYAHLDRFHGPIAAYVKEMHYRKESFEMDVFPDPGAFPVKKGEFIGYSGNSGGSAGPHLHFEIRLERTQTPVNPLFFGFSVKDYIRPEISWLKVAPAGAGSLVEGKAEAKVYRIDGWGEQHRVKGNDTIRVAGTFSLALNTIDKLNDTNNKNGVYSISLYVNGERVYFHEMEKFDFVETRYINSLIDYAEFVENRRQYQRSEVDPNNKLSIYRDVKNNGILEFPEAGIQHLEYVVTDFAGNISRLPIVIKSEGLPAPVTAVAIKGILFSAGGENHFTAPNIDLSMGSACLYRDLHFYYDTLPMEKGRFSRIHRLHDELTPVHTFFQVQITPDSLPDQPEKLLLARIDRDGKYIPYGGKWTGTSIAASIRSLGDYVILIDTVPPVITAVNIESGKIGDGRRTVKIKIRDEISGIRHYRATLNGSWLLMDYDAKNDLLTYEIDDRLKAGVNIFRLEVIDQRDNATVFEKTLLRH